MKHWTATILYAGLGISGTFFAVLAHAKDEPSQPRERLGTLFYSATERGAITRTRQGDTSSTEASAIVTVSGLVKRKHGKSTVWINGQTVNEGDSLAPTGETIISTTGIIMDGQRVRVGEALDINTHERIDIVTPGAVTIKGQK